MKKEETKDKETEVIFPMTVLELGRSDIEGALCTFEEEVYEV